MTNVQSPGQFDEELARRMNILQTEEVASATHRRVSGKHFAVFVGVTLLICLIGAGVATL